MRFIALLPLLLTTGTSVRAWGTRDTTDICAHIAAPLVVINPANNQPTPVGFLDVCVCISNVVQFINTNPIAQQAVQLAGFPQTQAAVTTLIFNSAGAPCHYPDHAIPQCQNFNPCSFFCIAGFTATPAGPFPTSCTCLPPNIVCNGACGAFSGCPSGVPVTNAKVKQARGLERMCEKKGWTACGVGRGKEWECVNTRSDLENCGGCAIPTNPSAPSGQDCSTLPGVSDVSCLKGTCVISRCDAGYKLSLDRSSCVTGNMVVES